MQTSQFRRNIIIYVLSSKLFGNVFRRNFTKNIAHIYKLSMISKFLRPTAVIRWNVPARRLQCVRQYSSMIPPNQYDTPFPKKLQIGYVVKEYWETIPLFVTTLVAMGILFGAIAWACMHKVDLVFTTHSRENISRTMDLRNPSIHKAVIINQRYEPWPEMQDLLDKMKSAEKRAAVRAMTCPQ